MQAIQQLGIEFILFIQSFHSPALDQFFHAITQFGGGAYLFLIPLVIWCFAPRLGLRATLAMLIAQFVVMVMKDYFGQPRPFQVDPRILSEGEWGLSFPSGHAQGAMVYYGLIAAVVARRWVTIGLGLLIFLVGLSRPYLGVHYPHDVIAGWMIGAGLLYLWLSLEDSTASFFRGLSVEKRALLGVILPLGLAALHNFFFDNPSTYAIAGAVSGTIFCLASPAVDQWFHGRDRVWRKVARFALGMPALFLLIQGMRYTWPDEPNSTLALLTFINGAVMMLFIGLAAPRLFGWLRLIPSAQTRPERGSAAH
ncbi:MAG: phosphatase PAP2 family protein [Myxococcota bacterium]|jgi:membrane-associated phospholipid phosphatase|nr:phosphatase PAP2 family protein [Myxococcota bacterium]